MALHPDLTFPGYTYIEEMKSDGIEDCMKYLHKFDFENYFKPFSYYNRIIWFAFLRRIDKEKKQEYIKYKNSLNVQDYSHTPEMMQKIAELEDKFEKSNIEQDSTSD